MSDEPRADSSTRPPSNEESVEPSRLKQFWTWITSGVKNNGREEFLPRNYRLQVARLRQILGGKEKYTDLLAKDPMSVDWSDMYELDLAIVREIPESQVSLELQVLRQRFIDVVGRPPEITVLAHDTPTPDDAQNKKRNTP